MQNIPKIWDNMPEKFQIISQNGEIIKLYGSSDGVFCCQDKRLCTENHFVDASTSQLLFKRIQNKTSTIKEIVDVTLYRDNEDRRAITEQEYNQRKGFCQKLFIEQAHDNWQDEEFNSEQDYLDYLTETELAKRYEKLTRLNKKEFYQYVCDNYNYERQTLLLIQNLLDYAEKIEPKKRIDFLKKMDFLDSDDFGLDLLQI